MSPSPDREDPELEALLAETSAAVASAIDGLVRAQVRYYLNLEAAGLDAALARVTDALRTQILESALMGARTVLTASKRAAPANAATISYVESPPVNARVVLGEASPTRAVAAILRREPRLAKTYQQVALLYSRENAFAAVRAVDITTAARVQGAIAEALKQGVSTIDASEVIQGLSNWTPAYADNVFRTNAATAYADGMRTQANDPDVRAIMVGVEVLHPVDGDTRRNHAPMAGFRMSLDDPRLRQLSPPYGYRCRGSLDFVDRAHAARQGWLDDRGELRRMEVPAGFHVDEGFRK